MVITGQNGPDMPHPVPQPDELREIQELNHLFLLLLQGRARSGAECLGLSASVTRRIRDASPTVIDGMATFPRALFTLNLNADSVPAPVEELGDPLGRTRYALTLTVLLSAWHMTRQRSFQARMFLGLSVSESRYLRTLPLSELQVLGASAGLLGCAFAEAETLWITLLRHAEYGIPPALRLVGLQPQLITDFDRGTERLPGSLTA